MPYSPIRFKLIIKYDNIYKIYCQQTFLHSSTGEKYLQKGDENPLRKNRLLTVSDLVTFCERQNFQHFNSEESGYQICVQIPAKFEKELESNDELLIAPVLAFHTGNNRNRSSVTESAAKKAIKELAYKPVLANFCEIDGVRDFTSHDFEIDDNDNFTYYEKQVGCFTADKPYMEQDADHDDRMNVFARVAIPRQYTDAADIIERKGGTDCSVELLVNDMSWNQNDKVLLLNDITVTALTLLGKDPSTGKEVLPGMEGAHVQLEDFSVENNSLTFNSKIINEIAEAVVNKLGDAKNQRKEEQVVKMDNENIKDIDFEEATKDVESEETTEQEIAPAVETEAEAKDEAADVTPEVVEKSIEESVEETEKFADEDPATEEEPAEEDEHQSTSAIEDEDSTGTRIENSLNYSVTIDGVKKEFAVSLADKINAVTTLVNDTYSESDNTWYYCDVFEDDGRYCVMHDFWGDRHYRQEYSVKKDVYSLKGDRVQVYAQYLTSDEIAKLDKMKSDFASIESELNSYKDKELHSQREAVLASEDYSVMGEFSEFNDLKDHMDDYSVEELTNKADLIYAKYMKSNYSNFSANQQKKTGIVFMASSEKTEEERLPYGGLFKNFKNKK